MAKHKLPMAEVERQAWNTFFRPIRRLPASWWEPEVAENMARWMEWKKNNGCL